MYALTNHKTNIKNKINNFIDLLRFGLFSHFMYILIYNPHNRRNLSSTVYNTKKKIMTSTALLSEATSVDTMIKVKNNNNKIFKK